MRMLEKPIKPYLIAALAIIGIGVSAVLFYAICQVADDHIYCRDHKAIRDIRLLHVYDREYERFEIELPVKFVPAMHHNAGVRQKLIVRAEDRKCFMILRFEDGRILLIPFPIRRRWLTGWIAVYYEITDTAAKTQLEKLLDAHSRTDD